MTCGNAARYNGFHFTRYYPSKDVDGAIIRPLPKVKHALSDAMNLPHIVQLLLTFDPVLVEKVRRTE